MDAKDLLTVYMSCELTADTVKVTTTVRNIPHLHRFHTLQINVPHASGTRVLFNTQSDAFSNGSTGFTYNNSNGRITNNTGRTLLVHISFSIVWNQLFNAGTRMAFITLNETTQRFGCISFDSADDISMNTGSVILKMNQGDFITVWVYQNTGFDMLLSNNFGCPYITLTVI